VTLVVRSMYKDIVLLLHEDRMLSCNELKKKVILLAACKFHTEKSELSYSFLSSFAVT